MEVDGGRNGPEERKRGLPKKDQKGFEEGPEEWDRELNLIKAL